MKVIRKGTISVVIPTYNRAQVLCRAIESALDQTLPPDEVVVIDDGSTDRTEQIIERLRTRICYVRQENAGASAARNRGVRESRGEWIAFLDSDDFWAEEYLQRMREAIVATAGRAQVYFSDSLSISELPLTSHWVRCNFAARAPYELCLEATEWAMLPKQPMMIQASIVDRETYLHLGGFSEHLPSREDTHLFFRMCLGRAACAVSLCGTYLTGDDVSNRLTTVYGKATTQYWHATVFLYTDVLQQIDCLSVRHRRSLRSRLADAHFRMARLSWEDRQVFKMGSHLCRGCLVSPRAMLRRFVSFRTSSG